MGRRWRRDSGGEKSYVATFPCNLRAYQYWSCLSYLCLKFKMSWKFVTTENMDFYNRQWSDRLVNRYVSIPTGILTTVCIKGLMYRYHARTLFSSIENRYLLTDMVVKHRHIIKIICPTIRKKKRCYWSVNLASMIIIAWLGLNSNTLIAYCWFIFLDGYDKL